MGSLSRAYPWQPGGIVNLEAEAYARTRCSSAQEHQDNEDVSCGTPGAAVSGDRCKSSTCLHCGHLATFRAATTEPYWSTPDSAYRSPVRDTFPEWLKNLTLALHAEFTYLRSNEGLQHLRSCEIENVLSPQRGPAESDDVLIRDGDTALDLGTRIGVSVFFRLLKSLRQKKNVRGILRLIDQVPSLISDVPALSLSSRTTRAQQPQSYGSATEGCSTAFDGLTAGVGQVGVVDAVTFAAEGLLSDDYDLSCEQRGRVLAALLGLAVKQGSLSRCLRIANLLLLHANARGSATLPFAGQHLQELAAMRPSCSDVTCGEEKSTAHLVGLDDDQPGLLSLFQNSANTMTSTSKQESTEGCTARDRSHARAVAGALDGVELVKVEEGASVSVGLTTQGELLAWHSLAEETTCRNAMREESSSSDFSGPGRQSCALSSLRGGCGRIRGCACFERTTNPQSASATGLRSMHCCATPLVWRMLAERSPVADVACGEHHVLTLLENGDVFSWGSGSQGQLGLGDTTDREFPVRIDAFDGLGVGAISCGASHSLAICSVGATYAWGSNAKGQCGESPRLGADVLSPRKLKEFESVQVVGLAGGENHTLALASDGDVRSLGIHLNPEDGEHTSPTRAGPEAVDGGWDGRVQGFGCERVSSISCGWHHSMAVTTDGVLFTWGSGYAGQLGHGDTASCGGPKRVAFFSTPAGGRVHCAVGGRDQSAATTTDGRVFTWGTNSRHSPGKDSPCMSNGGTGGLRDRETIEFAGSHVSIPAPATCIGLQDAKALRLCQGIDLRFVLVEAPSGVGYQQCGDGTEEEANTSGCSTEGLLSNSAPAASGGSSHGVERVDATIALLEHMERLGSPHIPPNLTKAIDQCAHRASRIGLRLKCHALGDDDLERYLSRLGLSTPSIPFCVSACRETFRNVRDLMSEIMQRRTHITCSGQDDSYDMEKRERQQVPRIRRRVSDSIPHPEANMARAYTKTEANGLHGKVKHHPTQARHNAFATSQKRANEHMLNRTLRLLTLNLFHLARAIAIRCGLRGQDGAAPDALDCPGPTHAGVQLDHQFPRGTRCSQGNETERRRITPKEAAHHSTPGKSAPSHRGDATEHAEQREEDATPGMQQAILNSMGQDVPPVVRGEEVLEVMRDLHVAIRKILQEKRLDARGDMSSICRMMKAHAAGAFRAGFTIFFASHGQRTLLLRSIVDSVADKGSESSPDAQRKSSEPRLTENGGRSQGGLRNAQRATCPYVQVAVELLTRNKYAAGFVAEAFDDTIGVKTAEATILVQNREAYERLSADELDDILRRLLRHCASNAASCLWETDESQSPTSGGTVGESTVDACGGDTAVRLCPYLRLLLVLQTHVLARSDGDDGNCGASGAARDMSLAHARRLFEESFKLLELLCDRVDPVRSKKERALDDVRVNYIRRSVIGLVPLLCSSLAALNVDENHRLSRAAHLLPVVMPLLTSVDCLARSCSAHARLAAHARSYSSTPLSQRPPGVRWMVGLDEALAMLAANLIVGLAPARSPEHVRSAGSGRGARRPCNSAVGYDQDDSHLRREHEAGDDDIDVILMHLPFLAEHSHGFDWASQESSAPSPDETPEITQALATQVLAFEEETTCQLRCPCSRPLGGEMLSESELTADPNPARPQSQCKLPRAHRRASSDHVAKLNPIDPKARGAGESAPRENRALERSRAKSEAGDDRRRIANKSTRLLDSIVDDSCAEKFMQDLLCGRGTALALYQWMAVPLELQPPVLHATSLATQGQGWGSYQSLNVHAVSGIGHDKHDRAGTQRRQNSRVLRSDIDAATRAVVGVMIRSNNLMTEAATFARCRLDHASSPPPALKLVAAAAVEVRQALTTFFGSFGEDSDSCDCTPGGGSRPGGSGHVGSGTERSSAAAKAAACDSVTATATLAALVRNCHFLLKSNRLPPVALDRDLDTRKGPRTRQQQSPASRVPDSRRAFASLAQVLRRWARNAVTKEESNNDRSCDEPESNGADRLLLVLDKVVRGRLQEALLVDPFGRQERTSAGSMYLELLLAFAASEVRLDDLRKRIRTKQVKLQVREASDRLVHGLLHHVRLPPARRQLCAHFAQSMNLRLRDASYMGIEGPHAARRSTVSLLRHIVYELCRRDSTCSEPNAATPESSTLLDHLYFLQAIATSMDAASLLELSSGAQRTAELDTEEGIRKVQTQGLSPSCAGQEGLVLKRSQSLSCCAGRASSAPSPMRAAATILPLSCAHALNGEDPVTVVAIRVLGDILAKEGDALRSDGWHSRCAPVNTKIHDATWRAACVAFVRMSSPRRAAQIASARSQTRYRLGPTSSKQTQARRGGAARANVCPKTLEAVLTVLFDEISRVGGCIEKLSTGRESGDRALAATGAVRLVVGPTSLPLPTTPSYEALFKDGHKECFAVSFWVWTPEIEYSTFTEGQEHPCSSLPTESPRSSLRVPVFTRIADASSGDKASNSTRSGRPPGAFLTPLNVAERAQRKPVADRSEPGGIFVEIVHLQDESVAMAKERQNAGARLDATQEVGPVIPRQEIDGVSADLERTEGSIARDPLEQSTVSKCPLPPGRWTHVSCSLSSKEEVTGRPSESDTHQGANDVDSNRLITATITFNGFLVAKNVSSSGAVPHAEENDGTSETVESPTVGTSATVPDLGGAERGGSRQLLCDIYWHSREITCETAGIMACNGIRARREYARNAACDYGQRLIALAHTLANSLHQAVVALSTPRWMFLLLEVGQMCGQHAYRASLRLLRTILCVPVSDACSDAEVHNNCSRASSTKCGLRDRAIVDRLCESLGNSVPSLSCGDGKKMARFGRKLTEQAFTNHDVFCTEFCSPASDIVALLRFLLREAPARWQRHIHASFSSGLLAFEQNLGCVSNAPCADRDGDAQENEKSSPATAEHSEQSAQLGRALACVYVGGGYIEEHRLGARVAILRDVTRQTSNAAGVSSPQSRRRSRDGRRRACCNVYTPAEVGIASGATACRASTGTLIGWQQTRETDEDVIILCDEVNQGCVGRATPSDGGAESCTRLGVQHATPQPVRRRHVCTVPQRHVRVVSEEAAPPVPYFFGEGLPAVISLVQSIAMPKGGIGSNTDTESRIHRTLEGTIVRTHLRCRLVRALAVQLGYRDQAHRMLQGNLLPALLGLGGTSLKSTVVLALGSDGAIAFGRRRHLSAILLAFSQDDSTAMRSSSILTDLELACQIAWQRLRFGDCEQGSRPSQDSTPAGTKRDAGTRGRQSADPRPILKAMGGEAVVHGNRITASSHFPTVRLFNVALTAGTGRWYYEVTLLTGGLIQLGWAGPLFQCRPVQGQGVGDNRHSWAFDGFRQKRWCVSSAPYGKRWRAGDVVGVLLDSGLPEMRFSLNGRDLGVAFTDFNQENLYPAASMNVGQAAHFNFGYAPFLYAPADDEGQSVRPILEAVTTSKSNSPGSGSRARHCGRGDSQLMDPSALREQSMGNNGAVSTRAGTGEEDVAFAGPRGALGVSSNDVDEEDAATESMINFGGNRRPYDSLRDGGMLSSMGEEGAQAELERQGLVENLIGMGFPVEWAIRAAERSDGVVSESSATAWIIEQLEAESSKLEEELGNIDTCEADSAGGDSDQAQDSDDADANATTFGDGEGKEENSQARTDDGSRDRRWREMYSAVRASFIARGRGDSQTTPATFHAGHDGPTAGVVADSSVEVSWAGARETRRSSSSARRQAGGHSAAQKIPPRRACRLVDTAIVAADEDLPCLSIIFDTALAILFARAAVINILSHLSGSKSCFVHRWGSHVADPLHMSQFEEGLDTTHTNSQGTGNSGCVLNTERRTSRVQVARVPAGCCDGGDSTLRGEPRRADEDIALGVQEALSVPDHQSRFAHLTKLLLHWPPSQRSTASDANDGVPTFDTTAGLSGFEGTHLDHFKPSDNLDSHPRTFVHGPGDALKASCPTAVRCLFELAASPLECSTELRSTREPNEEDEPSSGNRYSGDATRGIWLSHLRRFVTLLVGDAISALEHHAATIRALQRGSAGSYDARGEDFSGSEPSRTDPFWAAWVLAKFVELESEHRGLSRPSGYRAYMSKRAQRRKRVSVWTTNNECNDTISDESRASVSTITAAWSPRAFNALLSCAGEASLGEDFRAYAYGICAHMLHFSHSLHERDLKVSPTDEDSSTASELGLLQQALERDLGTDFSARLRQEAASQSEASPLLQRQLELLAQFERREFALRREQGKSDRSLSERTDSGTRLSVRSKATTTSGHYTTMGEECNVDDSEEERKREESLSSSGGYRAPYQSEARRPHRSGRLENQMASRREDDVTEGASEPAPHHFSERAASGECSILVESTSPTSVMLSWGGWSDDSDAPKQQVSLGGNGLPFPLAFGKAVGSSNLAQALRSKLKMTRAQSLTKDDKSFLLKVCAGGIWGWEPFGVAASDLGSCGCIKVHGLKPDTGYHFALECLNSASPPLTACVRDDGETPDDPSVCSTPPSANSTASTPSFTFSPLDEEQGVDDSTGLAVPSLQEESSCHGSEGASDIEGGTPTGQIKHSPGHEYARSATAPAAAYPTRCRHACGEIATPLEVDGSQCNWDWPWVYNSRGPSVRPGRPDSSIFRAEVENTRAGTVVATLSVATPPEVALTLDPERCGVNLRLCNSNLTVTNMGRKKWSAARATRGFSAGVHRWRVHVDSCVSKNVFIGVASAELKPNNYVGSDGSGWGYLANKAIWHNRSKVRSYGDIFQQGDSIDVTLNMDLGTLRFARNGRDLGVAVQGLEGTLYPAVSLYNRKDQLTLIPQDDRATCRVNGVGNFVPKKVNSAETDGERVSHGAYERALHGTFTAEGLVKRAAKVLKYSDVLVRGGAFETDGGVELAENTRALLIHWFKGEQGRSLKYAWGCEPIRVDTSRRACHRFCGLGIGDRITSADGEATVVGVARQCVWVSEQPSSPTSTPSRVGPQSPAWRADAADVDEDMIERIYRRRSAESTLNAALSPRISGARGSKITSWSRCTVRKIMNSPKDFTIRRHMTKFDPVLSKGQEGVERSAHDTRGSTADELVIEDFRACDMRDVLSNWTPAMDAELTSRLNELADQTAVLSPLDLPFGALKQLPASERRFPLTTKRKRLEVVARVTLLLIVNELVVPLLPVVDVSYGGNGQLAATLVKWRHIILTKTKTITQTSAIEPKPRLRRHGVEYGANLTITLRGFEALPSEPVAPKTAPAECPTKVPWTQWSNEISQSVFGQTARQLCGRNPQQVSAVSTIFPVILTDAQRKNGNHVPHVPTEADARKLCEGLFWQVCAEVCSPPVAMFTSETQAVTQKSRAAAEPLSGSDEPSQPAFEAGRGTIDTVQIPDPTFTYDPDSSVAVMDPRRLSYFRSLGLIVGLAVRTRVPLPTLQLHPSWWMLVTSLGNDSFGAVGNAELGPPESPEQQSESASLNANIEESACAEFGVGDLSPGKVCAEPSTGTSERTPALDDVISDLHRLQAAHIERAIVEDVLGDARFVAPLANGQVKELFPGGSYLPVTSKNVGGYCALLSELRVMEYAPQAAAFRAGLESVISSTFLSLLTWRELEQLVCIGWSQSSIP